MKTVKSRLFKKYLKRRKSATLNLKWLHFSANKSLKTALLLAHEFKYEEYLGFGPTLTLIFPTFGECVKGSLYILKKVGLSTF